MSSYCCTDTVYLIGSIKSSTSDTPRSIGRGTGALTDQNWWTARIRWHPVLTRVSEARSGRDYSDHNTYRHVLYNEFRQ